MRGVTLRLAWTVILLTNGRWSSKRPDAATSVTGLVGKRILRANISKKFLSSSPHKPNRWNFLPTFLEQDCKPPHFFCRCLCQGIVVWLVGRHWCPMTLRPYDDLNRSAAVSSKGRSESANHAALDVSTHKIFGVLGHYSHSRIDDGENSLEQFFRIKGLSHFSTKTDSLSFFQKK